MFLTMESHLKEIAKTRDLQYIADSFGKYAGVGELARFLARYELFKKVATLKGSIVECGVKSGSGLMQWRHLSSLLDPHGHLRTIYGFDTFEGFPSTTDRDRGAKPGDQCDSCFDDLVACINMHESPVLFQPAEGHFARKYPWPKVTLIKGDFMQTADQAIAGNQHLVIALLFLDFDLYEPTKKALEVFVPRMPKGSIIAFDELNNHVWPGETQAVLETIGLNNHRLNKFPFEMNISWIEI